MCKSNDRKLNDKDYATGLSVEWDMYAKNGSRLITRRCEIMKVLGVIPARYGSSRFPGKPLADVCGKPMIWWVYTNMKKSNRLDDLIVATEDHRVMEVCNSYSMKCMMTSDHCKTGTDRIAEVSTKMDADLYVAIFGDEPLLSAECVDLLINDAINSNYDSSMLVTKFKNPVDVVNTTTVKVALNSDCEIIFMSRLPIPYPKGKIGYDYYKHVGAYALKKDALRLYIDNEKGPLEEAEDVETLRLLEKHKLVHAVLVDTDSMSVDTPKDLKRINELLSNGVALNNA